MNFTRHKTPETHDVRTVTVDGVTHELPRYVTQGAISWSTNVLLQLMKREWARPGSEMDYYSYRPPRKAAVAADDDCYLVLDIVRTRDGSVFRWGHPPHCLKGSVRICCAATSVSEPPVWKGSSPL